MDAIAGHEDARAISSTRRPTSRPREAWPRLRGLDVGSHGYWHHTYRTEEENFRNIRRGIEILRAAGIEPRGFAAPHGRFNAGAGRGDDPAGHHAQRRVRPGLRRVAVRAHGRRGRCRFPSIPCASGCSWRRRGGMADARRRRPRPASGRPSPRRATTSANSPGRDTGWASRCSSTAIRTGGSGRYPEVLRRVFDDRRRVRGDLEDDGKPVRRVVARPRRPCGSA